ncbi:MAG: acyltransferase [candidate division Zixibacteria bacterium]|nr:acyltransferase [candidate division Zixibacteria bacterium]
MSDAKLKINSLTGIRAFAALWVVVFHFRSNAGIGGSIDYNWFAFRGYWGVDIFFVLSGFILAYIYSKEFSSDTFSPTAYKKFLIRRIARIYPLHLATFLVFVGFLLTGYWSGHALVIENRCTLPGVGYNLLLIHGWGFTDRLTWNYPAWSISSEWFAYLFLFYFSTRILRHIKLWLGWTIVGASWLLLCLSANHISGTINSFTFESILRIVPEFMAGCFLYRLLQSGFGEKWTNAGTIFGLVSIAILSQMGDRWEILLLPCICILIASLYQGGSLGNAMFSSKPIVFLGEISYSIYLVHPIVQIVGNQIVGGMNLAPSPLTGWIVLGIELSAVVALASGGYFYVERPLRRWLIARLDSRTRTEQRTAIPSFESAHSAR